MHSSAEIKGYQAASATKKSAIFNRWGRMPDQLFAFKGRRLFRWAGVTLYALFLLFFFLYLTFPYHQLENHLISRLEGMLASQIQVNESRWLFPVGLAWKNVRLRPQNGFKKDVVVDQASAKLYLLPLLSKTVETDFFVEAYGGKIRGSMMIQRHDAIANFYVQQTAQDIKLQAIGLDLPVQVNGRMRVDLEVSWADQEVLRGQGSGRIELMGIQTEQLSVDGWGLPDLTFSRVTANLTLRNGILTVDNFKAEGTQIDATGQGTMLLRKDLSEGLLNLAAKAYLKEDLRQKFPLLAMAGSSRDAIEVLVKGTLQRPLISINGVPIPL